MLRLAVLLLSVAAGAAEQAKPQELPLTSTSLAGKASHLVATVPAGFSAVVKPMPKFGSALETLMVDSADQRVRLLITLLPPNDFLGRDAAGLEKTLRANCAPFLKESVEGKVTPFPLQLKHGIGVATFLTDKAEVGKPATQGPEHYKLMTNAMIRIGDATLATVTIFHDTKEQADYLAAIKVVASLRPDR